MSFLYKYTFSANVPGHGLSETLYFERADDNVDAAVVSVNDVTTKRIRLLGKQGKAVAVRVQLILDNDNPDVEILRRGRLVKFAFDQGFGTQANNCCEPNVSLQVAFTTANFTRRKLLMMGGAWAGIFPAVDTYDPNFGAWASYFGQWIQACQAIPFGWLGNSDNPVKYKVTGYVQDPISGLVTFTVQAPGITWPNNTDAVSLNIDVPLTRSPLDGKHLVSHSSATTFTTLKPIGVRPYPPGQLIQVWIDTDEFVSLAPIPPSNAPGRIDGQNAVTRKRGRPTYASRGRLPTAVHF